MCLINTSPYKGKKKYGWKAVFFAKDSPHRRDLPYSVKDDDIMPEYGEMIFKLGEWHKAEELERFREELTYEPGFHVCLKKQDAIRCLDSYWGMKLMKVEFTDVIISGVTKHRNLPCVVARKIKPIKVFK